MDNNKQKLYCLAALFDKAEDIIRASKETVKSGYTKFDTNTPYPVHGIEKAMSLKPSFVGFITLFFGLSGAAFAFLFMTWVTVSSYPLIIGGKPFFTWPAFVPITFEVTVLFAAVGTALALLFVLFRFPYTSHPLHDTDYMKAVSADKFGINILTIDPIFDEQKVHDFLSHLGTKNIYYIYEPESSTEKIKVFEPKFIGLILITFILSSAATYYTLNRLLFIIPFSWMSKQPKVLPQTQSTFFSDGYSNRMPVEGTIARGFIPYEYKGMPDSLIKLLSNPLPVDSVVMARGKDKFNIYCSPCHGYYGKGDSRLHGQFPNPPTLHSDKVKNWPDGNIYNVITNGQNNIMPSYEKSISRDDRWAIIRYIRVLQRSQDAKDSDLDTSITK
jgi:hypothetical protein